MRQKKRKKKEKKTWHQRRQDSGKAKQITTWSVPTFKGKLKFYRCKIVRYKPRAFNRKIEIKTNSYFA